MPYFTVVAGTTITASWSNSNVRDQVVTPFASTAARDSAITSPVTGMVEYITANDNTEGITTRTSAGTWRQPWNMPWGQIQYAEVTTNQGSITTAVDLTALTTGSVTYVGHRINLITGYISAQGAAGNALARLDIVETSTVLASDQEAAIASNTGFRAFKRLVPSVGAHIYKLQFGRTTGSDTLTVVASSTNPCFILVQDMGPSSSPA